MSFDPAQMPVRAENMTLPQIEKARRTFDQKQEEEKETPWQLICKLYLSLTDFFDLATNPFPRRCQLGLKGWGKTFSTLLALNRIVHYTEYTPVLFFFDQQSHTIRMFNPLKIAPKEVWGDRLDHLASFDRALKTADIRIVDDIHYIFEFLAANPSRLPLFLTLLQKMLEHSANKKTMLVSEEPLFRYAEAFNHPQLNGFLSQFGLCPTSSHDRGKQSYIQWHKIEWAAYREVLYWTLQEWGSYLSFYSGMNFDVLVIQILYNINRSPRSLVKLTKLFRKFNNLKTITAPLLFELTKERLQQQGVPPETIDSYEVLFNEAPVVDFKQLVKATTALKLAHPMYDADDIDRAMRYLTNQLSTVHPQLLTQKSWLDTPYLILRRAFKQEGPLNFKTKIEELIRHRKTEPPPRLYLSTKFVPKPYYDADDQRELPEIIYRYVKVKINPKNIKRLYTIASKASRLDLKSRHYNNGILHEPFERAFGNFLREESSLNIISHLMPRSGNGQT